MDMQVLAAIVVVVSLVLLRLFGARRVAARQGQFVWLMFVPTMIGGVAILWVSIQLLASDPLLGAVLASSALIYLSVLVRFLRRVSGSISSAGPQDDIGTAITEPLADYLGTMVSLVLIAGLVALVGLVIWGVIQAM